MTAGRRARGLGLGGGGIGRAAPRTTITPEPCDLVSVYEVITPALHSLQTPALHSLPDGPPGHIKFPCSLGQQQVVALQHGRHCTGTAALLASLPHWTFSAVLAIMSAIQDKWRCRDYVHRPSAPRGRGPGHLENVNSGIE